MKIALAQINPTVGDVAGNADLIRRDIARAKDAGADLVVFPELAIVGYPPKDLLLKPAVIERCVADVDELATHCVGIAGVIGLPIPSQYPKGRLLHNAVAVCAQGRVQSHHIKSLLPTYDVFDELRYFEPGPEVDLTEVAGSRIGISICEDLWNDEAVFSRQLYHDNPIDLLANLGAALFVNCAASPFVVRKHAFRLKLMHQVAKRYSLPLLYCNQVGGNDELVFDGRSCAFDAQGNLIAHAKAFEEDLLIVDIDTQRPPSPDSASPPTPSTTPTPTPDPITEAYQALVLGLRDYCRKCGFTQIVLGLSGGIDSALTCAVAVAAIGADNVRGVAMPSRYSSEGSVKDAQALADRLGVRLDIIPIEEAHKSFEGMLADVFAGLSPDTTEENIQARIRGVLLMAFSNKFGSLLVTTGNKSELAVGYCTLYGDMNGGFSVLSDVPKTMVYDLSRWINTPSPSNDLYTRVGGPPIPEDTITKPPSAELRPDQTDQDSLPPYDVLDQIVERYVEREHAAKRIIADTGYEAELVLRIVRLIDLNEYKRKQTPPGLKITGRAFGFGRRMPIAQRWDNRAAW